MQTLGVREIIVQTDDSPHNNLDKLWDMVDDVLDSIDFKAIVLQKLGEVFHEDTYMFSVEIGAM